MVKRVHETFQGQIGYSGVFHRDIHNHHGSEDVESRARLRLYDELSRSRQGMNGVALRTIWRFETVTAMV